MKTTTEFLKIVSSPLMIALNLALTAFVSVFSIVIWDSRQSFIDTWSEAALGFIAVFFAINIFEFIGVHLLILSARLLRKIINSKTV